MCASNRKGYLNGTKDTHKAALRVLMSDFSLMLRLNQLHKGVLCHSYSTGTFAQSLEI